MLDAPPWDVVRKHLAEVWYSRPIRLRRERLVARHIAFGKAPDHAAGRVATVDEPNARLVAATRTAPTWSSTWRRSEHAGASASSGPPS